MTTADNQLEPRQCGCVDKKTGQRCTEIAIPTSRVCARHGGHLSSRYGRALPPRMLDAYEEGFKDPEMGDLKPEIALIHSRIIELFKRVDKTESSAHWKRTREMAREYKATKDPDVLDALLKAIDKGANEADTWDEIFSLQTRKKTFIESERKRLIETNQMISLGAMLGILAKIGLLFEKYVSDPILRKKMAQEIGNIITVKPISSEMPELFEGGDGNA